MNLNTDIAVVGYGPVGQAMAIAMAQQGYKVVVLERWPSLYNLPRAVGYDHEVGRILQWLGVSDAMKNGVASITDYIWRNGEGQLLKSFGSLEQIGLSGWPQGQSFCQPKLELALDARARSFDDQVCIYQGWEVTEAAEHDGHVVVTARNCENANIMTVKAKYVIGCDGAGSVIRQAMDTTYEDLGFSADWLVVDYLPNDPTAWNADMIQVCDPKRPTTLVAGGPGRRRAEFMLLEGETKDAMNTPDMAWRLLAEHGWNPGNAVLERHAVYTFKGCVARRWNAGRMILAGDAAHLTPPFAGQGLCAGLRDVISLSWRLHHILSGRASPAILHSYGQERGEHVRQFIDFAIELGRIICVLDPAAAMARDAALTKLDHNEKDDFPSPRLPYSDLVRTGDPLGGLLSLQGEVSQDGVLQRFDDLVGYGFTLLSLDADPIADLTQPDLDLMDLLQIRLVRIGPGRDLEDPHGQYEQWFQTLGCRTVLIRPDFYLYAGGDALGMLSRLRQTGLWKVHDNGHHGKHNTSGKQLISQYFKARQAAQISPTSLRQWQTESERNILVVDVRNPIPASSTRIPGSYVLPEREIHARFNELPRDKLLILVCWDSNCGLATSAAVQLLELGFEVMEPRGGIQAWSSMGLPVTTAELKTAVGSTS